MLTGMYLWGNSPNGFWSTTPGPVVVDISSDDLGQVLVARHDDALAVEVQRQVAEHVVSLDAPVLLDGLGADVEEGGQQHLLAGVELLVLLRRLAAASFVSGV